MDIRDIITLLESTNNTIYHWCSYSRAMTALSRNKLQYRSWSHYLENEERFVKGTSWSFDSQRWKIDFPIRLSADISKIKNKIHSINGHRTYLLTKSMTNRLFDPNAYKLESTIPDEEFIEGTIQPLSDIIVEVKYQNLSSEEVAKLTALANKLSININKL